MAYAFRVWQKVHVIHKFTTLDLKQFICVVVYHLYLLNVLTIITYITLNNYNILCP